MGSGSSAVQTAAWIRLSWSGNTRNSVPSAIPAAIALCAIVTAVQQTPGDYD